MKRSFSTIIFLLIGIPLFSYAATPSLSDIYQSGGPVKILIIPGHDNEFSGAKYRGVTEADMAVDLANKIADTLRTDPRLMVTVSRTKDGYLPELQNYFDTHQSDVADFIHTKKQETASLIDSGKITNTDNHVPHSNAPDGAVYRLYATNKWINESGFNLVLHVHFNDYGSRPFEKPGQFSGYTVYVPDDSLPNAEPSFGIATKLANRLARVWKPGVEANKANNMFPNGIIKDYKLIAMGSYRTLDVPSILLESSFIYEPQVQPDLFQKTTDAIARSIGIGLHEYFTNKKSLTRDISYVWKKNLAKSVVKAKDLKPDNDVLMLQYALAEMDYFPPKGKTQDDCKFDGIYGACTISAMRVFQAKNHLGIDGKAGPKTRAILNKLFK